MLKSEILTKDNINNICSNLETLFAHGTYGSESEEYSPHAAVQKAGQHRPEGLTIAVDAASMGFNTVTIPFGAELFSYENAGINYTFRWTPGNGSVKFTLNVTDSIIRFLAFDTNTSCTLCETCFA